MFLKIGRLIWPDRRREGERLTITEPFSIPHEMERERVPGEGLADSSNECLRMWGQGKRKDHME